MALNTIILPYNKISEVEECEPISSPSSTSFEEHKTVPDLNSLYSTLYKNYNLPLEICNQRNKSSPPSLNAHALDELLLGENNNQNISIYSHNLNLNIEKEKEKENNKDNSSFEQSSRINNHHIYRVNKNPFKKENDNLNENESESLENPFLRANLRKNHRESDLVDKSKLHKIDNNYINNPKITPVKEDIQIDSFMEEMNNIESKVNINFEKNSNSLNKKEIPKTKPKINENNKINLSSTVNYRNSNPIPIIKNGIYCKKKITDSKISLEKKGDDEESSIHSNSSIKKEFLKTDNYREIKAKKRPLTLNVNLKKKKLAKLKIAQFQKIMKIDGLFYILRFLDYYDIINLFKAKNKKLCILINTALANVYYFSVKESLIKYSNIIELIKCTIVQSKIKDALKIDFVINIRFINNKKIPNKNYKIKLNDKNNKFVEPFYLQFGYIYNYYPKIKTKKQLITKEEYENEIKKLKMYDYYTFDLYPEEYITDNNSYKNSPIFISKELSLFEKDGNNNIVNIQPILPFCINDKGIINLEIYTTNNGFIEPDSIRIIVKSYILKNYLKMLSDKKISNPRISECEDLCSYWKNINLYVHHKSIMFRLKKLFEPYFEINKIYFGNIGVFIFKVYLKAIKSGLIKDNNNLEIIIKIKDKDNYIENEIRKNNLLFERRDIFEIRVGEELIYYFSLK